MLHTWLVRPSPHGNNRMELFLKDNFIAIGWPGMGDLSGKSRMQLKAALAAPPYSYDSLELGNAYATFDIFVNQMNIDDFVLVADEDDIHFCKIISDYYFEPQYDTNNTGYSHQRKVEWLSFISRQQLPLPLRKSLRVHRATADLTEHAKTIIAFANGHTSNTSEAITTSITVNYPLRPNVLIPISFPSDITKSEAERFGDFIKTVFFDQ